MNKTAVLFCVVLLLGLPAAGRAEQDELLASRGQAGAGAAFINTPANAYGISTAGILTIFGDSCDAVFWNPAGLAQIPNAQLQLSSGLLNNDKLMSSICFAKPYGEDRNNAFAITLLNAYVGRIDSYDSADNYLHQLEYMGNAMIVTFAKPLSIIRFGLNLKVMNEIMDKARSYGGSMDLGISITPPLPIFLGITIKDFPGFIKWDHQKQIYRTGSGYNIGIGYKDMMDRVKFGLVFDKAYGEDSVFINLGGEFALASFLSIRLGYFRSNFSGGLGLDLGFADLSYAFYNERFLDLATVSQLASLTINF